jgi:hypothetical protein
MLTLIIVVHAGAVASTPNAAFYSYSLAPGAASGLISPPAGQSVLLMGSNTTYGDRGVGQVAMLHITGAFLEWVGLNSTRNGTIAQGYSAVAGTKIVQLDFGGYVYVEVANADNFEIVNSDTIAQTGNVTLIW